METYSKAGTWMMLRVALELMGTEVAVSRQCQKILSHLGKWGQKGPALHQVFSPPGHTISPCFQEKHHGVSRASRQALQGWERSPTQADQALGKASSTPGSWYIFQMVFKLGETKGPPRTVMFSFMQG